MILTLAQIDLEEFEKDALKEAEEERKRKKEVIQNKIRALGKLANVFSNIRKQNESMVKLKAAQDKPLPLGVKAEGNFNFGKSIPLSYLF